jgi:hypothetical protein
MELVLDTRSRSHYEDINIFPTRSVDGSVCVCACVCVRACACVCLFLRVESVFECLSLMPLPPLHFPRSGRRLKGTDKKGEGHNKVIVDVREFRSSLPSLIHAAGKGQKKRWR